MRRVSVVAMVWWVHCTSSLLCHCRCNCNHHNIIFSIVTMRSSDSEDLVATVGVGRAEGRNMMMMQEVSVLGANSSSCTSSSSSSIW